MSDATNRTISLQTPITRGEQSIPSLTLRQPKGGDLRGLSLAQLSQSDFNQVQTLVTRIANPSITKEEFANLDPADMMEISGEIVGFFLTNAQKAAFQT
jgi:Phage tail assembly chaperone proteins, E, or 41 or 14